MVASLAFGFMDQYMSHIAMPSMPKEDIWIARFPKVSSVHRSISCGPAVSSCALIARSSESVMEPRTVPGVGTTVVDGAEVIASAAVVRRMGMWSYGLG